MFFKEREETIPMLPVLPNQWSYDYILVAENMKHQDGCEFQKQEAFRCQLEKKGLTVHKITHDKLLFFGLRAPKELFEQYKYLLKVSDACNWSEDQDSNVSNSVRIRIVHYILYHTFINTGENFQELLNKDIFQESFCLHEKKVQKELSKTWANWCSLLKIQPDEDIHNVKDYFGEKVALYFLWLGWYTLMLWPAALIGVVVFLYGLAFFRTNPLIKEVCESNTIMCPRCDNRCTVWKLSDTCTDAKVSHLFDNEGTVAFAMFMAIWATLFLELWKRHRAQYVSKWKVFDWCEDEEELILGVVNDSNIRPKLYRHAYWRTALELLLVTLMLVLIIGLTQALVIFRVVAVVVLSEGTWDFIQENANTVAVILASVLHYITIQVMTRVNRYVSLKLCDIEKTRTFAATERSFTVKMFTFQFFTLFSSLIYVAFFLGRINGRPGSYLRVAGKWRLEECHPSGCLTDLFIQMAIIMILKQTINNVVEFSVPLFKRWVEKKKTKKLTRKCGDCYKKACRDMSGTTNPCDVCKLNDWLRNHDLPNVDAFSIFNEFLEMVIQFSFTTIFVAAFPLAPLLALINNIFEIRLDAIKMVRLERRLVSKKTNDIGIWTLILEVIGVLAVIANGLVIGVSSDFIPRMVYRYRYGPCVNGTTGIDCMEGYISDSLSTVYMTNPDVRADFLPVQLITHTGINVTQCSYKDYRSDVDYSLTSQFWLVLAVRFAFVILFEHVMVVCKFIAAWFVPDNPTKVKNTRLEDKFERLRKNLGEYKKCCEDQRHDGSTEV
ncbi:anoctamin-9 [Aplochiton taeniatus]